MRFSENVQGIFFMSGSMAAFVLNDTLMKHSGVDLGLAQSIFVRGLFASVLISAVAWASGGFARLPGKKDAKLIGLRTVSELGATVCFLTALYNMPLANITAILQSLPLTITLAAALFLGDRLSWRRSAAILAGALGVLIIIRPGAEGFNGYALLGLAAVGFVTYRDLIVRKMSRAVPSSFVASVTAIVITIASGIALLVSGEWVPVPMATVAVLALAAVFVVMGYHFSIAAMRFGDVNIVTPFRYTAILWATFLGWIVFGEIPDGWTLLGMAIILLAGLYTIWRGNRLRENQMRRADTASAAKPG